MERPPFLRGHTNPARLAEPGERIKVYWPPDQLFYVGTVEYTDSRGTVSVLYDDQNRDKLNLPKQVWDFVKDEELAQMPSASNAKSGLVEPAPLPELRKISSRLPSQVSTEHTNFGDPVPSEVLQPEGLAAKAISMQQISPEEADIVKLRQNVGLHGTNPGLSVLLEAIGMEQAQSVEVAPMQQRLDMETYGSQRAGSSVINSNQIQKDGQRFERSINEIGTQADVQDSPNKRTTDVVQNEINQIFCQPESSVRNALIQPSPQSTTVPVAVTSEVQNFVEYPMSVRQNTKYERLNPDPIVDVLAPDVIFAATILHGIPDEEERRRAERDAQQSHSQVPFPDPRH